MWVKNNTGNYPPKIHNILTILQQAKVTLSDDDLVFLLKLNQYQIKGRYPEDIVSLYKITNEETASHYLTNIKRIAQCLTDKLQ